MGHQRIICIGDYDQYYEARSYIHHKENPDYYHDLETGKRDDEDAYRWYAPDDIFGADWVGIAKSGKKEFDNISKENFLFNLDKQYPFWVYEKENLVFDARLIDDESTKDNIELNCLNKDEFIKLLNELPPNTLLQILDSHW